MNEKKQNEKKQIELGFGRAPEDLGLIVGTEEGLKNLIQACETALQQNEYAGMNLGGIEGIKKVEISYFNPIPSQTVKIKSTFIRLSGNIFTAIATIYLVSAQIVGMYIVLNWLFS